MGLARMLPRSEIVIVTTPALAAQKVATRAADMARKGYLRVAGVVENMTAFTCTHGDTYALFGEGGGERLAADIGVPLLGQIPLSPAVARGGDVGAPVSLDTDDPAADAFVALADTIAAQQVPAVEMAGCTARLLDQVEAALGPKST
jgi:ATP-binding protein involved in chromosome partitioning